MTHPIQTSSPELAKNSREAHPAAPTVAIPSPGCSRVAQAIVAAMLSTTAAAWAAAPTGSLSSTAAPAPTATSANTWTQGDRAHVLVQGKAPVRQALEVIVPQPWEIVMGDEVDGSKIMAWPSGNSWRYALELATAGAGLSFDINDARRTVTINDPQIQLQRVAERRAALQGDASAVGNPAPAVKVEVAETSSKMPKSSADSAVAVFVDAPKAEASAVQPAATIETSDISSATPLSEAKEGPRFYLSSGRPLSKQMRDWAEIEGWTLIWELREDWIVPSPSSFPGPFIPALSGVISALSANGADIRADVYKPNRTIVIHSAGTKSFQRPAE